MNDLLILSRADNPGLRTIQDVMAAIPPSVIDVVIDEAEYLVPRDERTPPRVRSFMKEIMLAAEATNSRNLTIGASASFLEDGDL